MTATGHFRQLARLLELEAAAEARQAVEEARALAPGKAEGDGNSLVDMVLREESIGLGGRLLLTYSKSKAARPLPWTRLGSGSPVLVFPTKASADEGVRGIVVERGPTSVQVAVDARVELDPDAETWTVSLAADEVSRERQLAALRAAEGARKGRLAELRDVLLGERQPRFEAETPFAPFDPHLNEPQLAAIRHALAATDVAILHGPPGTGKTTVVVELIRQLVARGERVLACAPSNLAVDNILQRLVAAGVGAVRLGHPVRILPGNRARSLDVLVADHDDVRMARQLTKEAHALFRRAGRYTRAKPEPGARGTMRAEARALLADARKLEAVAVGHVLDSAPVVCATTTGLDGELLGTRGFDTAVIDEACQATEPAAWPPIVRSGRLILAGDHQQLPPTIISPEAARSGLSVSLPERLLGLHGAAVARQLTLQYRMHRAIMNYSSHEFYGGSLHADATVAEHLLSDLAEVLLGRDSDLPVEFIDTAGAGFEEEERGASRRNPGEARLLARKARALVAAGLAPAKLAVITPYGAQVRLLRDLLADIEGLEIDSVDGFQGREKEAVLLSLVRSNPRGAIGFLAEARRLNVAWTRARRKVIVIGDSATLAAEPLFERLIAHVEREGGYRSVWEDPDHLSE